jgi:hypothetical protein
VSNRGSFSQADVEGTRLDELATVNMCLTIRPASSRGASSTQHLHADGLKSHLGSALRPRPAAVANVTSMKDFRAWSA